MKEILITLITLGMFIVSSYAGDLWKVENGSYVSTDYNSLVWLYNTRHGTDHYRAIRDLLIERGTLLPCSPGMVVEAISYQGGVATIMDTQGNIGYIPQEDFVRYLGARHTNTFNAFNVGE